MDERAEQHCSGRPFELAAEVGGVGDELADVVGLDHRLALVAGEDGGELALHDDLLPMAADHHVGVEVRQEREIGRIPGSRPRTPLGRDGVAERSEMVPVEPAHHLLEEPAQCALVPQGPRQLGLARGVLGRAHVPHQSAERQQGAVLGIEVAELLLGELELSVTDGSREGSWLLRATDGTRFEVSPARAVNRLDAGYVRNALARRRGALLVGDSATPSIVSRADAGELDILTAHPIRLIHEGRTYTAGDQADPAPRPQPRHRGRPAWVRWALERYLLLAETPARQSDIAAPLHTSQQAVSSALRRLGDLVVDSGDGVIARDRRALLEHWIDDYPGPGGQEFGWYGLADAREQAVTSCTVTDSLDLQPLVGGDVAADIIAPWKLPTSARVYVREPVDLTGDGFAPAPLDEATLVTCVPRDPTLWQLTSIGRAAGGGDDLPLADPLIVLWDLLSSADIDSEPAAQKLADAIVGAR